MKPETVARRGGYRTDEVKLIKSRHRRESLKAERRCINGREHPLPLLGVRCEPCRKTHRKSAG